MSKKNRVIHGKLKALERKMPAFTTKVTVRLFLLLLICGIMSICCFRYLMQWQTWSYVQLWKLGWIEFDGEKMVEEIQEKAKHINFEGNRKKELIKLLDLEKYDDGYTSLIFYDGESGEYLFYGIEPKIWDSFVLDMFWYNDVAYYSGMNYRGEVKFQDTSKEVMIYSLHQAMIVVPYFFASLFLSMLLFLPVLIYVWNRMRYVGRLKEEILVMSEGDLEHPITVKGRDEIGILAGNLNEMRLTLDENIRREQGVQKANHDLISAISHDLRTPLTTLYGYLEIIGQKKCPEEKQEEYISRCIEKVKEIRILSDKMFEYALVYETRENVELSELYLEELLEELEQNREFLELRGYQVHTEFHIEANARILGNRVFFQRTFNNLFSNILKYGDAKEPVLVKVTTDKGWLQMVFLNGKTHLKEQVESNRIGLKSVQKMVELQKGNFFAAEEGETFAVTLKFPLIRNDESLG